MHCTDNQLVTKSKYTPNPTKLTQRKTNWLLTKNTQNIYEKFQPELNQQALLLNKAMNMWKTFPYSFFCPRLVNWRHAILSQFLVVHERFFVAR